MQVNDTKSIFLTVDECIKIRASLFNTTNTLNRLIKQNDALSSFYNRELELVNEVKKILTEALRRDL